MERRTFIKSSTAFAGVTILTNPRTVFCADANAKLKMACIGAGGRAGAGIGAASGEHLVAVAEVDWDRAAKNLKKVEGKFPDLKKYTDYRKLFDQHDDLDAVWVGTPDHHHFPASVRALSQGAGVYCEKPLTWSLGEARALRELAAEKKVATQMGNQGHSSEGIRLIVEYLRGGKLGPVTDVVAEMGKGWGATAYGAKAEVPANLNWDTWLGPAPRMDYRVGLHPGHWRKYVPFGTGTLGDMACHTLDGAVWGLRLHEVDEFEVEAEQGRATAEGHPVDARFRWSFPARGDMPATTMSWSQGGTKAELPEGAVEHAIRGMNTTYVGTKGFMQSNSHCGSVRLIPETFQKEVGKPEQSIARVKGGHSGDFLRAVREGEGAELPSSHFGYSSRLTEIILAGVAASIVGEKLTYSMVKGQFVNHAGANALLWRTPRKGWEFGYES